MISVFLDVHALFFVVLAVAAGILILIKKENRIHDGLQIGKLIVLIITLSYLVITLADLQDLSTLGTKLSFILLSNLYMFIILIVEKTVSCLYTK